MQQNKHRRFPYKSIQELADRNEDYFGTADIVSLSVVNIGYDLRHSIDLAEQEHSMLDFHNDIEGSIGLFMDLSDGAFETDRRIIGRLNASFNLENSLTRYFKRHV